MHLQNVEKIADMEKFECYIVEGIVRDKPHVIEGGHLIFTLEDESGTLNAQLMNQPNNSGNLLGNWNLKIF